MAGYVIVAVQVTDPDKYAAYGKGAAAAIAQYGGQLVVRPGQRETLEGDWGPSQMVVVKFDSVEQAKRWWYSPEYQAAIGLRENATARFDAIVIQGE